MKTLTQHIEERLIINKNFKHKEVFKPNTAIELQDYVDSRVDELIKNDEDVLDMSNVDLSSLKSNSSNDKPIYQIFRQPFKKIRKNNITVDVSYWDVTDYTRIDCVFFGCECIETIIGLDTWDVSNVKDFAGLFSKCSNLKNVNVSGWKPKNASTMLAMFYNCKNLTRIDGLDTWDFVNNRSIDMSNMFYDCHNLNDIGDIEYWENATGNIDGMFYNCNSLTPPRWYRERYN